VVAVGDDSAGGNPPSRELAEEKGCQADFVTVRVGRPVVETAACLLARGVRVEA